MAGRQQALQQERAALEREATALADKSEAWTEAEDARATEIIGRKKTLAAEIEKHEALRFDERNGTAATVVRDLGANKPWGFDYGADAILTSSTATAKERERARNIAFGEQLQAVYKADRGLGIDPRLFAAPPGLGQNETIGADGAYLIAQQVSNDLAFRIWGGQILPRVDRTTLTSGVNSLRRNYVVSYSGADGSRHGGARAYWTEEAGEKTASKISFDYWLAVLWKIAGLAYATDEVLEDVGALGSTIFKALSAEIRWELEKAIFNGDGVGKPQGFNHVNNLSLITVSKEGGQGAGTIQFENVAKMYMRMYPGSLSNAVWLVNNDINFALSTMKFDTGLTAVPVWMPAGGISGAPNTTLYGRPIIVTDFSPTLGQVGDIAFVDLSQYELLEKGGIKTDTSIHVQFITDQTAFRAVMRAGGGPTWKTVWTPAQGSTTTSPFVVLETR